MNHSHFIHYIIDNFECRYSIDNVLDNDYDAILSMIFYVQNREPSSVYMYCKGRKL